MKVKYYQDIESLIVSFLIKYGLTELYLKNLPSNKNCIGCTRNNGDHDGECPIDYSNWQWDIKRCKTTQTIKKQIEEIINIYL